MQAGLLGSHLLKNFPNAKLVTSPLRRALETTQIIASHLNQPIEIDDRLSERNFSFPTNTTSATSRILQEKSYLDPANSFPGGESVLQHRIRVEAWISDLQHFPISSLPLILVSHGGTIEHIQACFQGSPLSAMARFFCLCETCHYHLWTVIYPHDGRLVWRLDGINLSHKNKYNNQY
jgi:2,3-bisphosphoglycerate-dependent phosphoglycerate mutase